MDKNCPAESIPCSAPGTLDYDFDYFFLKRFMWYD